LYNSVFVGLVRREVELVAKNKLRVLELVKNIIPPHVSCVFIRQSEALGLGHAVHCAKPVVGVINEGPYCLTVKCK
jgi:UTP-glucose-1-phosphate uridylyltransferase